MDFSKALDKLGDTAITREDEEDDIGAAFQKFAVVTKELSALMKNMVSGECFITFYENSAINAAKCSGIALIIPIIIHSRNIQNLISYSECCNFLLLLQLPTLMLCYDKIWLLRSFKSLLKVCLKEVRINFSEDLREL